MLQEFRDAPSYDPASPAYRNLACPWLICSNIWVPDWFAEASFRIVRLDTMDGGATRVNFVYNGDKAPFPSGWLDIDPERSGLVLGYEFNVKTKFSEGKEIAHSDYIVIDGKPVLKRRTIDVPLMVSAKFGNSSQRQIDEYETELRAPPDDEFYLSFYGLPEPVGLAREKSIPTYLWFLAGGVTCSVFTILIRRRGRQLYPLRKA